MESQVRRVSGRPRRPIIRIMAENKIRATAWYGGKFKHLDFILPYIPRNANHFVDAFGGGGSVLLNMPRFKQETYNDLNVDLVRFFRVLQSNGSELQRRIFFTPYSRWEYEEACNRGTKVCDEVEHVRAFVLRIRQSIASQISTGGSSWSYSRVMAGRQNKSTGAWARWAFYLDDAIRRLHKVNIENLPAVDLIRKHDSKDTVFYLDPPYVHDSRKDKTNYAEYEMSNDDHKELGYVLNNIKGRAVLSGYKNDLYDNDLFKHWKRVDDKVRCSPSSLFGVDGAGRASSKHKRQESLWLNF